MQSHFSIQDILSGNIAQLEALFHSAAAPAPANNLRATTADKLCAFLLKRDYFDLALTQQLDALQQSLSQQIAQDDTFYSNASHPMRVVLHMILGRAITWYARDAKPSVQFFEKLSELIQACVSGDPHHLYIVRETFQRWLSSEDKRAAMLETRLCESEINHVNMLGAETRVLDFINAALAFKTFPVDASAGIASILKNELLHSYFTGGSENPFWKIWQRLLPLLGKTFVTINLQERSEEDEQSLYRTIPALLHQLELSLEINTSHPESYSHWVEIISAQLMLAIKKHTIHCEPFVALDYPEGYKSAQTRVTTDVLNQIQHLEKDDWILFSGENGQMIRCKLALRNLDLDQFLFVDHTGRKVMSKSAKDLAICFSTGIAKKLVLTDIDTGITRIIQALIDLHQQKQHQLQAEAQAQAAKNLAAAELQRQQDEKRKQDADAETKRQIVEKLAERQAAAQKALAEAAALAAERSRRAAEQVIEQERIRLQLEAEKAAEHLQRIQLATIEISTLNLGARVELVINNEPVRCKLAVIIAATGKYIFVDSLGRKVAELQREQLVQALLQNQLTLLNKGDSFDDQLVKVIRGLRKDIS